MSDFCSDIRQCNLNKTCKKKIKFSYVALMSQKKSSQMFKRLFL